MKGSEMTNELVAEKVMGWDAYVEFRGGYNHVCFVRNAEGQRKRDRLKDCVSIDAVDIDSRIHVVHMDATFLTDMNSAMMVVEKMKQDGFKAEMTCYPDDVNVASFYKYDYSGTKIIHTKYQDKSLPTAICNAALKALGHEA